MFKSSMITTSLYSHDVGIMILSSILSSEPEFHLFGFAKFKFVLSSWKLCWHCGSTSIWLRLLRDTLVQFSWAGQGRVAIEFLWGRNIFSISLFKSREILEGSNIFHDLGLASLKEMDTVGESGLKQVYFPLRYNTMLSPLCMLA